MAHAHPRHSTPHSRETSTPDSESTTGTGRLWVCNLCLLRSAFSSSSLRLVSSSSCPLRPPSSDEVEVPSDLPAGKYLLSWRWDCEESTQVSLDQSESKPIVNSEVETHQDVRFGRTALISRSSRCAGVETRQDKIGQDKTKQIRARQSYHTTQCAILCSGLRSRVLWSKVGTCEVIKKHEINYREEPLRAPR